MTADHPTPASLASVLRRAEQRVADRLQPLLEEHDLTLPDWRVLAALGEEPGLPMTTLGDRAGLPAATLTRRTDLLVQRALLLRRVNPADRRSVVVALSARGRVLAGRLAEAESGAVDAVRRELMAHPGLGPQDRSVVASSSASVTPA